MMGRKALKLTTCVYILFRKFINCGICISIILSTMYITLKYYKYYIINTIIFININLY